MTAHPLFLRRFQSTSSGLGRLARMQCGSTLHRSAPRWLSFTINASFTGGFPYRRSKQCPPQPSNLSVYVPLPKLYFVTTSFRDLKPDNILLDEKGNAHITDLNIAVHYSERRMLTGVAGSMAYMGTRTLSLQSFCERRSFQVVGVGSELT